MGDGVYYSPYISKNGYITIICYQWFDEMDYKKDNFLKRKSGTRIIFETEEDAKKWVNEYIQYDKIDPDYRDGYSNFFKKEFE